MTFGTPEVHITWVVVQVKLVDETKEGAKERYVRKKEETTLSNLLPQETTNYIENLFPTAKRIDLKAAEKNQRHTSLNDVGAQKDDEGSTD